MEGNLFTFNFKTMKKGFIKVLIFVIIIIVSDKSIGGICKKLYEKSNDFGIFKLRYTLNSANEDILVFGSSRAEYHFIPAIIKEKTGLSVYNCGIGGADLLFSRIQLTEALKRSLPKYIVVEASPSSFFIPNAKEARKMLLPFYDRDTLIYSALGGDNLFGKVKYFSSIYPYNSTIASLVKGAIKSNSDSASGYLPAVGIIDTNGLSAKVNMAYGPIEMPSENFTYLGQIIEDCKLQGIRVFVVSSPVYQLNSKHDGMVKQIEIFCSPFSNVNYLDYSKHESIYGKTNLFKDNTHLNAEGAIVFSEIFAARLRELMNIAYIK